MPLKRSFVLKSNVKQWFTTTTTIPMSASSSDFGYEVGKRPIVLSRSVTLLNCVSAMCLYWNCGFTDVALITLPQRWLNELSVKRISEWLISKWNAAITCSQDEHWFNSGSLPLTLYRGTKEEPLVLHDTSWRLCRRWANLNPSTAKLFNLNFHPLEVVSRWRDPQLQVSENYSDLTKWRSTLFKSCWLMSHFIFNIFKMG